MHIEILFDHLYVLISIIFHLCDIEIRTRENLKLYKHN